MNESGVVVMRIWVPAWCSVQLPPEVRHMLDRGEAYVQIIVDNVDGGATFVVRTRPLGQSE